MLGGRISINDVVFSVDASGGWEYNGFYCIPSLRLQAFSPRSVLSRIRLAVSPN